MIREGMSSGEFYDFLIEYLHHIEPTENENKEISLFGYLPCPVGGYKCFNTYFFNLDLLGFKIDISHCHTHISLKKNSNLFHQITYPHFYSEVFPLHHFFSDSHQSKKSEKEFRSQIYHGKASLCKLISQNLILHGVTEEEYHHYYLNHGF